MIWLLNYIVIGMIVSFVIDWSTNIERSRSGEDIPEYTNFDRLFLIAVWPIVIILFIKNLIK